MERPTREFKTTGGHTVVLKTYLTAGERRTVNKIVLSNAKISVEGKVPKIESFDPEISAAIQDVIINHLVISLDGSTENILARCLELPEADFDEISKTIEQATEEGQKKTD